MKQSTLAIILIVLGGLALAYQGFSYTTHEKVIDLGPIQTTVAEKHSFPLPPIVGALAITAGLVLLYRSRSNG
jgi:hypothetical protein